MHRFLFWACVASAGLVVEAAAQAPAKVPRVGWLGTGTAATSSDRASGDFQVGMRDLGYNEGRNVVLDIRDAQGKSERLNELAQDMVRGKVDVIVTSGEDAVFAAKRATSTIPIVATEFGVDPVRAGLVASLARPERNVTGLASLSEDLWEKRIRLLQEFAPRVSRIAVLSNPNNPRNVTCLDEITRVAKSAGLVVQPHAAGSGDANQRAFAAMAKAPPDAIAVCWDGGTLDHAKAIADFGLAQRVPIVAPLREFVAAGALLSFGANLPAHRRRAAYYVDRILRGSGPSSLPVERPMNFELVVNLSTAKVLGLAMPPSLAVLADELMP